MEWSIVLLLGRNCHFIHSWLKFSGNKSSIRAYCLSNFCNYNLICRFSFAFLDFSLSPKQCCLLSSFNCHHSCLKLFVVFYRVLEGKVSYELWSCNHPWPQVRAASADVWWSHEPNFSVGANTVWCHHFVVISLYRRKYFFFKTLSLSLLFRVFEKSLQYVKRFSRYKNPDAVRQVREYPYILEVFEPYSSKKLEPHPFSWKFLFRTLIQLSES